MRSYRFLRSPWLSEWGARPYRSMGAGACGLSASSIGGGRWAVSPRRAQWRRGAALISSRPFPHRIVAVDPVADRQTEHMPHCTCFRDVRSLWATRAWRCLGRRLSIIQLAKTTEVSSKGRYSALFHPVIGWMCPTTLSGDAGRCGIPAGQGDVYGQGVEVDRIRWLRETIQERWQGLTERLKGRPRGTRRSDEQGPDALRPGL